MRKLLIYCSQSDLHPTLLSQFAALRNQITLMWACIEQLPEILQHKVKASHLLFPNGSISEVASFYRGNPIVDYYNRLVQKHLCDDIKSRYANLACGQKLRILEIGAGTGGTTANVLPALVPFSDKLSYVYSDISAGFTQFGAQNFAQQYDFMEFEVLDIEKDIQAQGFAPHSFDVILACNVLHATANLQQVLTRTRSLLKPQGRLILNEATRADDYVRLTFGLLEGWWLFEDKSIRLPGGPLLDAPRWRNVLAAAGYGAVSVIGELGPDGVESGNIVLVANGENVAIRDESASASSSASSTDLHRLPVLPKLIDIVSQALMIEAHSIDLSCSLDVYGLDSFIALEVVNKINETFGITLRQTDLFNFATLSALNEAISAALNEKLSTKPKSEQKTAPSASAHVAQNHSHNEPNQSLAEIAVIGMSGRFPHAENIDEFWQNLVQGKDCIDDVAPKRWSGAQLQGGYLAAIDNFDPLFFKISPTEAQWMDPQQRVFLQEAWRTFENAGYCPTMLKGSRCGVFVGAREGDYLDLFDQLPVNGYEGTGNSNAVLSGRIAYLLDLKGPCLSVDTACSSALVAVHLACENITNGHCDLALAGGVSISLTTRSHLIFAKSGMLSSSGRCKTFDSGADGFVPSEAAGAVLLKPLEQAMLDGDHIYGVIQAHGINQDGQTNGITAASSTSQTALQQQVYDKFGIDPRTISYVEAHGTATALGDPIEIDGLKDAFAQYTDDKGFCAIGSVKTNVGHTLAAAGITGLIKVLLSLKHQQLPPSLHYRQQNPLLALEQSPFYVNTALCPWQASKGGVLRAAVSAYGFSGTNAHCVLEQAPVDAKTNHERGDYHLMVLSAKTPIDLQAKIKHLSAWMAQQGKDYALSDIAATLLLKRADYQCRTSFVVQYHEDMLAQLEQLSAHEAKYWQPKLPEHKNQHILGLFGKKLLKELHTIANDNPEYQEYLLSLSDLYSQGYQLPWQQIYANQTYQTVPLPGYPFVGESYWLSQVNVAQSPSPLAITSALEGNKHTPESFFPLAEISAPTQTLLEFEKAQNYLRQFCGKLLIYKLNAIAGLSEIPQHFTQSGLGRKLGLSPKYQRLLTAMITALVEQQWLVMNGDYLQLSALAKQTLTALTEAELIAQKNQLLSEFPNIHAFVHLLWTCAQQYQPILSGKVSATEVIYPDRSFDLVKDIYKANPSADFYNALLVDNVINCVQSLQAHLPPDGKIRILEVGAGTGGTSALLLQKLQPFADCISYVYSDISTGFTEYGRRAYGQQHHFVAFEALNIEKPIEYKGVFAEPFDLIVAANVIHATANLQNTINNIKSLLLPNGYLFLNETTDVQIFALMTFGLLDGWWLFDDEIRIDNSPLLDEQMWLDFLKANQFDVAPAQGLDIDQQKGLAQHIIIAKQTEQSNHKAQYVSVKSENHTSDASAANPNGQGLTDVVTAQLCQSISYILGLDVNNLVVEQAFNDYGLDSISALDFIEHLNGKLAISLTVTDVFDHPNIAVLADYIKQKFALKAAVIAQDVAPKVTPKPLVEMAPAQAEVGELSDIAVIGLSGRFAGAKNVTEFWHNLIAAKSSITKPPKRWPENSYPVGYEAGFIDDIDYFDPLFFNWTGAEAEQSDPQQRIFLEQCYGALEDAAYPPDALDGVQCGVFAGVGMSDYLMNMQQNHYRGEAQAFWGNSPAVVAARISYFLNIKGPALAIDTACSSSLVAVHYARQSILSGECSIALAGGVFLCTLPYFHQLAIDAGMLSADNRCKPFSQDANGFVFGEGAGAIVLKKLTKAIEDGDNIRAVLKASGVNQDGRTNGMTAPSALSQAQLITSVYQKANIDPQTISYIETHGTGTKLGDPVEFEALCQAFASVDRADRPCLLGSVKSNIGHASLAAGIASVIKVVRSLEQQLLPPSLNFSKANEHLKFAQSPFAVNTTLTQWQTWQNQPRRAGVSGFGLGGTNAHLVLEQAPSATLPAVNRTHPVLIVLSAKTANSLQAKMHQLSDWLVTDGQHQSLTDIAYTLQVGRKHFNYRYSVVAEDHTGLVQLLAQAQQATLASAAHASVPSQAVDETVSCIARLNKQIGDLSQSHPLWQHLGKAYDSGEQINWLSIYQGAQYRRVSLPSYPFERSSFWFKSDTQATPSVDAAMPVKPQVKPKLPEQTWWQPVWQPSQLNPLPASVSYSGPLLLFADSQQSGAFWTHSPVIIVMRAKRYAFSLGQTTIVHIRDNCLADYQQLIEQLAQHGLLPHYILHRWADTPFDAQRLDDYLDCTINSLFLLTKVLLARAQSIPKMRLIYCYQSKSNDAYAIDCAVSGFARTVNQESDKLFCQTVAFCDGGLSHRPVWQGVSQKVAQEFAAAASNQIELRYIGGSGEQQWQRQWLRWVIDTPIATDESIPFKEQGVYVITGGTGGLGLAFCRYLAGLAKQNKLSLSIILVGRRLLAPDVANTINALNGQYCQVAYVQADVTDEQQMMALREQVKTIYGKVTGIFHLAGVIKDGLIVNKSSADFAQVVSVKVLGTLCLKKVFGQDNLDFIGLFSSASAILGNPGQADYTFSNRFLDAFAEHSGIGDCHVFSTSWALWANGGMQLDEGKHQAVREQMGLEPLSTEMGIEAWQQALRSQRSQLLFLSGDKNKIIDFVKGHFSDEQSAKMHAQADVIAHQEKPVTAQLSGDFGGFLRQKVKQQLVSLLSEIIKIPRAQINTKAHFEEYGLDSIMVTHLTRKLNESFGKVSITILYDSSDLEEVITFLIDEVVVQGCGFYEQVVSQYQQAAKKESVQQSVQQSAPSQPPSHDDLLADYLDIDNIYRQAQLIGLPCLNDGKKPEPIVFEPNISAATRRIYAQAETVGVDDKTVIDANAECKTLPLSAANHREQAVYTQAASEKDNAASPSVANELFDVAIIGLSGVYPQADTVEQFWQNLVAGKDCVTEVPLQRWDVYQDYDSDRKQAINGKTYCKWGAFVADVDCFDAAFFNISPREAKIMDPTERLFLETAWATFEDAGYTRKSLEQSCQLKVGVFAGITSYAYALWGPEQWQQGNMSTPCGGLWSIANRVSYVMDLKGPSMPVDTACSASLSAVHQACMSLYHHECLMALAGGATFYLHPHQYVAMSQSQMLSPTGKCHSFAEQADGFVPGEGVGAVLLRPLAAAIAAKDSIYGVIKATAVNHGGRTNGYSVPSPKAQAQLIQLALDKADIAPQSISYVEAHGTGTSLGDPIEYEGLCRAWHSHGQQRAGEKQYCALGSVKSNIGHLHAAAGIAGLSKILLQFKYQQLVPSLHAEHLNPNIDFENSPFYIQTKNQAWLSEAGHHRRASVSSFGAGGANAHVIVEELKPSAMDIELTAQPSDTQKHLVVISARDEQGLSRYVRKLVDFIDHYPINLADFCHTLQVGRMAMAYRLAFVVSTKEELVRALEHYLSTAAAFEKQQGQGLAACVNGDVEPLSGQQQKALIDSQNIEQLAKYWVQGVDIDWHHTGIINLLGRSYAHARRMSLPTYPFEKKSYWYAEQQQVQHEQQISVNVLQQFEVAFDALEHLGAELLLKAIQSRGIFCDTKTRYKPSKLRKLLLVSQGYDALFEAMLSILQKSQYVVIKNAEICATDNVLNQRQHHTLDYWTDKYPLLAANFKLLWHCTGHLLDVLEGKMPGAEVIFPRSSKSLVEDVYKDNAVSQYFNQLVCEHTVALVRQKIDGLAKGQKIRIVEVGAGVGGTSSMLFKALAPFTQHIDYLYTDISATFTKYGKTHYSHYDFVEFKVLDIEKSIEQQGFDCYSCDVVIATNVLHATQNISNTLQKVKSLLYSGGELIINEAVSVHAFATLTFGLLKSWWLAQDNQNRLKDSPLLSVDLWRQQLESAGFYAVTKLTRAGQIAIGQEVITATSDGELSVDFISLVNDVEQQPIGQDKPTVNAQQGNGAVTEQVRQIVAQVIETEPSEVAIDHSYLDMGIDSILAIEIIDKVNQTFGLTLASSDLTKYSTVEHLSAHIRNDHNVDCST